MAKEKLIVVTERFFPEEFLINDLVTELQKKYEVEVLTQIPSYPYDKVYSGYNNKLYSHDYYKGMKVHRVYTKLGYKKSIINKILGYIMFALLTWKKAFHLAISANRVFFYHTGPATMAHSALVFNKIFRKKCFIWTQDIWPDAVFASGIKETKIRRKVLEIYLKKLYSNFDRVIVSCYGFIPILKKYYDKNIIHIPQWYPDEEIEITSNVVDNIIQFTFLGNLGTVQNLENVCKGFIIAIENGLKAKLNIVGDGVVYNDLVELASLKKCSDIVFWGRRPSEEMSQFINSSNVMVISLKDSPLFSLYVPAKFQGYTAGARPIFGIISGEVENIIKDNNIGYVANPSSQQDIAIAFQKFSNNIAELDEMGKRSRQFYKNNYDREICIKKILSEIEK